ncbi:GrrA/OscA1 family cyclophane-containing rSAM-modified RiPP [Fischerella sp. PCC 9605]|uniref:GrrA/OscA1 family cyclophane-containing rSAM-modified RiPP n=1 Tax=Fischerella sp. PCC 9605 TaxID=1173024 RepID=UPI00047919B8|nr:GrrA/OscA1 family cyclophane-containing rSAM-modified RiPP [Fischerella sp. PCC 9605]
MTITTGTGLVGFLLALSALSVPPAQVTTNQTLTQYSASTIEARLNRITTAIRERQTQRQGFSESGIEKLIAAGWADGDGKDWVNGRGRGWADGDGRDWVNSRVGGWGDGHGGGFANANPWRNGWADGGGFYNHH